MQIEIRPITADEYLPFARAGALVFQETPSDEELERQKAIFELDRSLGAFDGGKVVATSGIFSFEQTLPGPTTAPCAGVTWITVSPTHRRRGILTEIMRRQMAQMRERGEPIAALWASESIIYGRFGYGLSTVQAQMEIDPRHGQLEHTPEISGEVSLIDKDEAASILPPVFDRYRRGQPGEITVSDESWKAWLEDPPDSRHGMTARIFAVYRSADGAVEGYVTYRLKGEWNGGFPNGTLSAGPIIALTHEAYAALCRYLLGVDLVGKLELHNVRVEEPLRYMLADPRRLRTVAVGDGIWTRVIDIPAALAARRYATEDRLVLEITDRFLPENSGRYVVEGSPDGADCSRTDASEVDLSLSVQDLGTAYLGGVSFMSLCAAGRVKEERDGAVRRAAAMFASEPTPICTIGF